MLVAFGVAKLVQSLPASHVAPAEIGLENIDRLRGLLYHPVISRDGFDPVVDALDGRVVIGRGNRALDLLQSFVKRVHAGFELLQDGSRGENEDAAVPQVIAARQVTERGLVIRLFDEAADSEI